MHQICPILPLNRTNLFHVKRFGTMDGLCKCTFAKRREVRRGDLVRAKFCDRIKLEHVAVRLPHILPR